MGLVYHKKKAAPTQQVYLTPEEIKSRYTDWFDPSTSAAGMGRIAGKLG